MITNKLLLSINSILKGRAHIAGGALRSYFENTTPRDVDIFMVKGDIIEAHNLAKELYEKLADTLSPFEDIEVKLEEEGNYYSWDFEVDGVIISIIKPSQIYSRNTFGTPKEIAKEIDFNVCQMVLLEDNSVYFNGQDNKHNNTKNILMSIMTKQAVVTRFNSDEAKRTLKRVKKYQSYGYKFSVDDLDRLEDLI